MDARIPDGAWGGVQQVVAGLASGFASLEPSTDVRFLVLAEHTWLEPFLDSPDRVVVAPPALGSSKRRVLYQRLSKVLPRFAGLVRLAAPVAARISIPVPTSDGFLESLGPQLVHFATQQAFLTSVPSVYQPHDLQHLHLPDLFTPLQRRYREETYRRFADQAAMVLVMTEWGREDLVRSMGIDPKRVAVVPWAPVAGLGGARPATPAIPDVPDQFILYPAQTWAHKNHLRLLEALAVLRGRGERIDLVATGRQNEHYPAIKDRAIELGLADQVHFLGYVEPAVVDALYQRAAALVFPSLFEGWGLPVVEAFAYGVPVACSNVTVLPEVAAGAALLFDPIDVEGIAQAISKVLGDDALREELRRRGRARAAELSWTTTAGTCAALYRKILGMPLDAEASRLLAPPTLVA
jgi:glycosyltransferase involved in cell wall biosynthesis